MRRKRQRFDWVYRDDIYDDAGALFETGGTYTSTTNSIPPGVDASAAKILYDSSNYIGRMVGAGGVVPAYFGSAARAEGRKPYIKWCQGFFTWRPSTWALGSVSALGVRIAKFEQDPITGQILVTPTYTMWSRTNLTGDNPSNHANSHRHFLDRRLVRGFSDNAAIWTTQWSVPIRTTLQPHECLAIFFESAGNPNPPITSVTNILAGLYARTLVSDSSA